MQSLDVGVEPGRNPPGGLQHVLPGLAAADARQYCFDCHAVLHIALPLFRNIRLSEFPPPCPDRALIGVTGSAFFEAGSRHFRDFPETARLLPSLREQMYDRPTFA
jgi:hypothetical protein